MHVLGNRIWGFSPELFNDPGGRPASDRPRTSGQPVPSDFPGILAIAADASARRPGATGCQVRSNSVAKSGQCVRRCASIAR